MSFFVRIINISLIKEYIYLIFLADKTNWYLYYVPKTIIKKNLINIIKINGDIRRSQKNLFY